MTPREYAIKEAEVDERSATRLAGLGGLVASVIANVVASHRLRASLDEIPKPKRIGDYFPGLRDASGVDKNIPTLRVPAFGNATYFDPDDYEGLGRDKREKAKQHGMIAYDPAFAKPGILAHELGHASMRLAPWYSPSRINQSYLRPVSNIAGFVAPAIAAAAALGASRGTKWDPVSRVVVPGLLGAGFGTLVGAPTLINEWQASSRAADYMRKAKVDEVDQKVNNKALGNAFNTYLLGAAVPAGVAAAIGGGLAKSAAGGILGGLGHYADWAAKGLLDLSRFTTAKPTTVMQPPKPVNIGSSPPVPSLPPSPPMLASQPPLLKAAGELKDAPILSGRLVASKSGWLLLQVPNAIVRGLFDAMHEPGIELPLQEDGSLNAHVSVLRPEEIANIPGGIEAVSERGHTFSWQIGPIVETVPAGWKGVSKVWFAKVRSKELEALRKSYGLSPIPDDGRKPFHLTLAVKRRNILRNNAVSKAT